MAKQVLTLNGFGGGINKDADGTDLSSTGNPLEDEVRSAENIYLDQHGKIINSTPLVQADTGLYGFDLGSAQGGAWTADVVYTTPVEATVYSGSGDEVLFVYTTNNSGVPTFTIVQTGYGLAVDDTMRFAEPGDASKYYVATVKSIHGSAATDGTYTTRSLMNITEGDIYDTTANKVLLYDDKLNRAEGIYKHGEVILYNKYTDYMSFLPSTGELGSHNDGAAPSTCADGVNLLFRSDRRPVTDKTPISGVTWIGKGSEGCINIFLGADARGWSSQGSGKNSGSMFDVGTLVGGGRYVKQMTTKNEDAQRLTNLEDGGSTQSMYHITDNVGDIQDSYPPALGHDHEYDICGQVIASRTDDDKMNFTNLAEGSHPSSADPKLADLVGGDFSGAGGVNATDKQDASIDCHYHEIHDFMWLYWDITAPAEGSTLDWMEELSNEEDAHGADKQAGMALVFTPGKRSDAGEAWEGAYGRYCPSIYNKTIRLQIRIQNGAYIKSEEISGVYILAETSINSTLAVTTVVSVDDTCKTWFISRAELVAAMDSRGWVEVEKLVSNYLFEGGSYAGDDKILAFYIYVKKHKAMGLHAANNETYTSVFRLREFSFVETLSSGWAAYDYVKIFETRMNNGIESIPKQKVSTMTFEGGGDNAVACPSICKIRTNAQEVFIQRPAAADSTLTHGKLYYQGCDENGITFGEKFLLAEYDYTKGVKWAGQEDEGYQAWETTSTFPYGYGANSSVTYYEEPPVSSTYSLETGYPDGVETINALFKTATTVGRQVYIGNVAHQKVTEEGADVKKTQPLVTTAVAADYRLNFQATGNYVYWGTTGTDTEWADHGYAAGDSFIVTSGLSNANNQNVIYEITEIGTSGNSNRATVTPAPTTSATEDAVKIIYGFKAYDPSLISKTPPGSAAGFPNNTYIDLEFGGDKINILESTADRLLVFSDYKLTIVNVSQDIEFIEATLDHMGVSEPRQVCKVGEGVAWVNSSGVFYFDGENVNPLSADKLITENFSNASNNSAIAYDSTRDLLWIWIDDDKIYYYCFVTKSFIGYSSRSVGNYYKMPTTNTVAGKYGFSHYAYSSTALKRHFFIGDSITTTAADDRSILWQSGKIHCGTLGIRKRFYDVYINATNTYTKSTGTAMGVKLEWSIDNGTTWHRAKTNGYKGQTTTTNDRLEQNGQTRCGLVNAEGDGKTKANGKYIMLRIVHVSLGTTSAMEIADISLIYRDKKVK